MREESTYGDMILEVEAVDSARRVLHTRAELFGTKTHIELNADSAVKADRYHLEVTLLFCVKCTKTIEKRSAMQYNNNNYLETLWGRTVIIFGG